MYKENQDRIYKVMFAQRQLFLNPSDEGLKQFVDTCLVENPLYALEWMHRRALESENPFGLELFPTILRDTKYDRTKLARFYEVMIRDMMTAAYLREACLGLQAPDDRKAIWQARRVTGKAFLSMLKQVQYGQA